MPLGLFPKTGWGKTVAFAGANAEADDEDQPEELPAKHESAVGY